MVCADNFAQFFPFSNSTLGPSNIYTPGNYSSMSTKGFWIRHILTGGSESFEYESI